MKKYSAIFLIIISLLLTACSTPSGNHNNEINKKINSVKINDVIVEVEIAATEAETYRGLSWRENLCESCGMLFMFPEKTKLDFVMRNMNFPLDIIFADDDKIVKIYKNLPPEGSEPKAVYNSGRPANNVLEVNGGFADLNNIKIGDKIIYVK